MLIPIAEADDPRIAVFLGLRDHVARQRAEEPGGPMHGSFICEGDLVIGRALRAGHQLESVLVAASSTRQLDVPDGTPVYAAEPQVLEVITGRPKLRDPLACFARPAPMTLTDVLADATNVAVLQNVNNPNNMGVIMRCAAGLGMDAVLVDNQCCDPLYRRSIRASMGEVFVMPHARMGMTTGLQQLHAAGFMTLALTPEGTATPLSTIGVDSEQPVAVILGAEGPGLPPETLEAASQRVKIPMHRDVDSLNVAAAAAIAFHAIANRPGS